jgi:Tol biopolymer transport system component
VSEAMRKRNTIEAGRRERLALAITAACSVALSGGVIVSLIYLLLAIASLMAARPAFAQTAPVGAGVRLEAGIEKEDVDGDPKSAMAIYEKIASDTAAPRDVRAKALLRLAGCDEKLGKQAKQVYEQIAHDYAEQPAAAQARKRLALLSQQEHPTPPRTLSVRKIEWAGLGRTGECTTDGERAIYLASDGNLYFGDLAGHSRHLVFKGEPASSGSVDGVPSKDFSMVALALPTKPSRPATLALVRIDGTGYRELVRDDAQGSILGGSNLFETSWSWDHRSLLVPIYFGGKRANLLWVVSASDGQRRELVHTERYISKAVFSPDGNYVAYEVWPKEAMSVETSRIFVVPTRGGEPQMVYETGPWGQEDRFSVLKDWTSNGRFLAIKDVRQGKSALYLLPMTNGGASGPAAFVRYGEFDSAYTTASGALVYRERSTKPVQVGAFVASVDSDGHLGRWKHLEMRSRLDGFSPLPSFSPDGSQIAYLAGDADPARRDIVLQELSTGQERVLYQSLSKDLVCRFSAHNPKVFCTENVDGGGDANTELIAVAADSGLVERIASFQGSRIILQSPEDDKTFYFSAHTPYPGASPIVRWDRSTQQETVVSAFSDRNLAEAPSLDGRWLARMLDGTVQVQPTSGGDWKSLVSGVMEVLPPETTPDGQWVLYHAMDKAGKPSLFRVPIDGGDTQRLGDYPIQELLGNTLRISSDGRKIFAAEQESTSYDLWLLENFEPPIKK